MLKGVLIYKDEDYGDIQYTVHAKDSFESIKLYIQNENYAHITTLGKARELFDKQVVFEPSEVFPSQEIRKVFNPYSGVEVNEHRRLDIKKANKYKSNITNREFCSRVSALIRYAQMQGKKNYNQNVDPEDHFKLERLVKIDDIGYIKYNMALIKEISIKNKFLELTLEETDEILEGGVFKELKLKDKYDNILSHTPIENVGFKLHEDVLGFHYEPPIVKEPVNVFGMYETIEDVIEANPEKNTSWINDRNYEIVTDENLEAIMKDFYDFDGWISFDTETTGLKINFKSRSGEADQLVGVVLSKEKGTGYYFPLQHKLFPNLCGGDHWFFMEKYMKKLLETKKIIGHNTLFDWKVAYIYDINTNFLYDTMLAFGVTKRYEDATFKLSLKELTKNLFGLDMFDLSDFIIGGSFSDSDITFADLPYELVRQYAPADGDMTLSLFDYLEHHAILDKYDAHRVFDMEVNFAKVVAYSEFFGYHINVNHIPTMKEQIVGNMEKYKQQMVVIAGKDFNPNSPKQLTEIMYDELGIEMLGGKRTTNKETLKALSQYENPDGSKKYPFVVALKNYRDNEGIYKNFLKKLHTFATDDGFIFPEVMQLGTDTGRSSVKNPNYQSYNDPVKKNIVPRKGYWHFDCDFSQIEYRVLASLAGQDQLIEEFNDPDLDYHSYQAGRMFSIPYSLVSSDLRQQSKGINFGLPYGMGDPSLGARIFGERNSTNTNKAKALRRKFFQGQEKIEHFFQVTRDDGVANNFTSTYWGRRRYYDPANFTEQAIRRQAGNHVIQGTAADIYKEACNRMFNRIVSEGWLGLVLINAFVHDEALMEVHQSINPFYFFKAWREEFEVSIDGFAKLFAGAGASGSWYDAKKQDLPVGYIAEIIDAYDSNQDWDEDYEKFLVDIKEGYELYKTRRVRDYILNKDNDGEVIKPAIYSLLVEMVNKAIGDIQSSDEAVKLVKEYNALLTGDLIQVEGKHKIKLLKDYLGVFNHYNNIVQEIELKSPDELAVTKKTDEEETFEDVAFSDDEFSTEDLISFGGGYYKDVEKGILYLTDKSMVYDGIQTNTLTYFNNKGLFKPSGTYQLAVFNEGTKETVLYNAYMDDYGYQEVVSIYGALRGRSAQPMAWF